LDGLLARAAVELQPVPVDLTARIERQIKYAKRRRRLVWTSGLAAALTLAVLAATWWWVTPVTNVAPPPSPVVEAPARPSDQTPHSLAHVTFPRSADVIAVPMRTDNRAVTIIWVYPALRASVSPAQAPADVPDPHERKGL
jgi:hypothetical protein